MAYRIPNKATAFEGFRDKKSCKAKEYAVEFKFLSSLLWHPQTKVNSNKLSNDSGFYLASSCDSNEYELPLVANKHSSHPPKNMGPL